MKITKEPFGDSPATLIRATNGVGSTLTLTDFGAAVVGLKVPAGPQAGGLVDVALGYGRYDDYMHDGNFLGAAIGRYANRIAHGKLEISGVTYRLDRNQGGLHTLHGGADGWNRRLWAYGIDADSVTFSLHSPDGDQGFPGNADVKVVYTFTDDNTVRISYFAVSDADTVFNLTNHTYFNLDGEGAGNVLGNRMKLNASRFTPIDADSIPTGGIRSVAGTALDFTEGKKIGEGIDSEERQIALAGGYDHNFVIDGAFDDGRLSREMRCAATVCSEATGITMSVHTDMPGVQFYSGNGLGAGRPSKSGAAYARRGGFCLETQFFPDSPHHPNFPSAVFRQGEPFESVTEYAFISDPRPYGGKDENAADAEIRPF